MINVFIFYSLFSWQLTTVFVYSTQQRILAVHPIGGSVQVLSNHRIRTNFLVTNELLSFVRVLSEYI